MNSALKYGLLVGVVAVMFKAITNYYLVGQLSAEFYSTAIASFFLIAGIYIGVTHSMRKRRLSRHLDGSLPQHNPAVQLEENGPLPADCTNGAATLLEPLSKRELEVLQLIAAGRSNEEVAAELFIAVSTVKTHLINIYGKLEVRRRTQAIAKARQLRLL